MHLWMTQHKSKIFKYTRLHEALATIVPLHAKTLGIIFDSPKKFDRRNNSMVQGCLLQLNNAVKLNSVLFLKDKNIVTTALTNLLQPLLRQLTAPVLHITHWAPSCLTASAVCSDEVCATALTDSFLRLVGREEHACAGGSSKCVKCSFCRNQMFF